MSISKEFAKLGNLLFYGDAEYSTFTIFRDGDVLYHILSVCKKNGEMLCRENNENFFKPFGEISVAGAMLAQDGCAALGVTF